MATHSSLIYHEVSQVFGNFFKYTASFKWPQREKAHEFKSVEYGANLSFEVSNMKQ